MAASVALNNSLYPVNDRVATITFNRPERFNAITLEPTRELPRAIYVAAADADVPLIVMQGSARDAAAVIMCRSAQIHMRSTLEDRMKCARTRRLIFRPCGSALSRW